MSSRDKLLEEVYAVTSKIETTEREIQMLAVDSEITKKDLELQLLKLFREQRILNQELLTAPF